MAINSQLLLNYKQLVQTTPIQQAYQECITLIKFIRTTLEKQLPQLQFTANIVENQMDFSYFHATNPSLKQAGLKLQVVFFHKSCHFELWLSGYNRNTQCKYYPLLKNPPSEFSFSEQPDKTDYLPKTALPPKIPFFDAEQTSFALSDRANELLSFLSQNKIVE